MCCCCWSDISTSSSRSNISVFLRLRHGVVSFPTPVRASWLHALARCCLSVGSPHKTPSFVNSIVPKMVASIRGTFYHIFSLAAPCLWTTPRVFAPFIGSPSKVTSAVNGSKGREHVCRSSNSGSSGVNDNKRVMLEVFVACIGIGGYARASNSHQIPSKHPMTAFGSPEAPHPECSKGNLFRSRDRNRKASLSSEDRS